MASPQYPITKFLLGALADRPAASREIAVYLGSDTGDLSFSDGSTWRPVGVAGQFFNVKSYGAKGDGTTDDYAAISAAITAAGAGVVVLPPGTYRISHPLNLNTSGAMLLGAGMSATTLTVLPADFGNFGNAFMIQGSGQNCRVADIHLDGQKRNGANPANQCGGVAPAAGWMLERVWEDDCNYFGFWINATSDITLRDCRSSRGGNNDHIGGGTSTRVLIAGHRWDSNVLGNALDHVASTELIVQAGRQTSAAANAANIYLEGCADSQVVDCIMESGSITLKGDQAYNNSQIHESLRCSVRGCTLKGGTIQITHDQLASYGTQTLAWAGGYNRIAENTVDGSALGGILVLGGTGAALTSNGGDAVVGNTVHNPNATNQAAHNTGLDTISTAGIELSSTNPVTVADNSCIDDRGTHFMVRGISIRSSSGGGTHLVRNNTNTGMTAGGVGIDGGTGFMQTMGNSGFNPIGYNAGAQPAVPATTVALSNPFYADATVYITGGTVTAIAVDGQATGLTGGSFRVGFGKQITLTYSVIPTWKWIWD